MITKEDALIVIDIQYDFCQDGALAVTGGETIIDGVNKLAEQFDTVVLSQDWHPKNHLSFASNHDNAQAFDTIDMPYGEQTLWTDHCVEGTQGAMFRAELKPTEDKACAVVRKGMNKNVDSYSAFFENDKTTSTGLASFLKERGIKRVFFVGLAYDFCVGFSAIDAKNEGFEVFVVKDLTKSIARPLENGTTETSMDDTLDNKGIEILSKDDFNTQHTDKKMVF